MSLAIDQAATAAPRRSSSPPRLSPTLSSPAMMREQRRAAWLSVVPPALGTGVALVLLPSTGVSLTALALMLAMHFITMLGITTGYHRQFAHHAFKTTAPVKAMLIVMGSMAAQGPVIHWVSNHRRHHEFSDADGDPHSPHVDAGRRWPALHGLWHAHIGWMFTGAATNPGRYARDLLRDPMVARLNRLYRVWVVLGIAIPAVAGAWFAPDAAWSGAAEGALWGGLVRIFLVHHTTWSINSITHRFGARPYRTKERSTNNSWLAIPSAGEAWHNGHHAFPASARFGLEWWQIDLGYLLILALRKAGWAWDVHVPAASIQAMKRASGSPMSQ
jgi:stearoyl-CoA desaturase (Delta-9 desaturase)